MQETMSPSVGHPELNDELNAYLDGELDDDVRTRVEAHMITCSVCQLELDQLRATRNALRAMAPLRVPRPLTLEALPASGRGTTAARPGHAVLAALGWVWRLGSLATAACLLMALLATNVMVPGADTYLTRGAAEKGVDERQEGPAGVLADRSSSQRVAPPATPAVQGTAPAAPQAPQSQPPVPGGGAGGAVTQNQAGQPGTAPTPQAAAAFSAPQPPAGAAAGQPPSPAATTVARAASDASVSSAPTAPQPAPSDASVSASGTAERDRSEPGRGGAVWIAVALVTAAASATAFAVDRRLRRAASLSGR